MYREQNYPNLFLLIPAINYLFFFKFKTSIIVYCLSVKFVKYEIMHQIVSMCTLSDVYEKEIVCWHCVNFQVYSQGVGGPRTPLNDPSSQSCSNVMFLDCFTYIQH